MFYLIPLVAATGDSVLNQSIKLAQETAASWAKVWDTVINPANDLWSALVSLGLMLAGLCVLYIAFAKGIPAIEKQSWTELISMFIMPLVVLVFLGGNGALLANSAMLIHDVGFKQVTDILDYSGGDGSMSDAVSDVGSITAAKTQIDQAYGQCMNLLGEDLTQCMDAAKNAAQTSIQLAEQLAGKQLPELRQYQNNIARGIDQAARSQAQSNGNQSVGQNLLRDIGQNALIEIVKIVLSGMQWAFINMLEAALLLTALFAPIAMGLSVAPMEPKPIMSWFIGYVSLFGVQLGYNIIVGLVATVINMAGAVTYSDTAFMMFLAIFAPMLATAIATGGGMAAYNAIDKGTGMIQSFASSVVGVAVKGAVKAATKG